MKHIIELEIGSPVKLKDRANQKTGEEMKETIEKQSNAVQYNVLNGKECGLWEFTGVTSSGFPAGTARSPHNNPYVEI